MIAMSGGLALYYCGEACVYGSKMDVDFSPDVTESCGILYG